MILEAFSTVLHQEWGKNEDSAQDILHRWLLNILTESEGPANVIHNVIRTELSLLNISGEAVFAGKSSTGATLLQSLYLYCDSYERWQFSRWIHHLKPAAFHRR